MQSQAPEEFFSLKQAGDYAHVKRQAVYLAIKNRGLKAEKIGSRWRIKRADYDEWRANKYNRDKRKINGQLVFDLEKGHFSLNQVCKIFSETLGYSYSLQHLYYLVRTGQLKAFRKGSAWVIVKEDAIELLEKERGNDKRQRSFM